MGKLARLFPATPYFYSIGWIIWFVTLWILSSSAPEINDAPKIPHFDKIAHFGYFAGGAGLLTGYFLARKSKLSLLKLLTLVILIGSLVGAIDEYHQSFTPGRFGNDVFDWLADFLGTVAGALTMHWIWRRR